MADDKKPRVPVIKARVIGPDKASKPESQAIQVGDQKIWEATGSLAPPYDPLYLCLLPEHSSALRQNIDAYMTNIDGFGHRFEPIIDLEADDADEQIRNAMIEQKHHQQAEGDDKASAAVVPSDEEVEARKAQLREEMKRERSRLERFFAFCCADQSFISLRRETRQDRETLGYAFWEILRNPLGEIVEFVGMPAYTVRLRRLCEESVEVEERIRTSALSVDTRTVPRRFRTYVQSHEGVTVYFKEFGDPRVISARRGTAFKTIAELKRNDENDRPANELLYFEIPSPRTSYGIPRWIGAALAVEGGRMAEEVNHSYFDNKTVPPLIITVAGGHLTEDTVTELKATLENEIAGKGNFHKILVLEAEPIGADGPENAGRMRIDVKPLTTAQQSDALFLKYDERNADKVGNAFRLPRLLRGDVRDFNKGTALASLLFAEKQVFQPERDDFDFTMDRKILADMGIRFWRFVSNGPVERDPETFTTMILNLTKAGVLTPEEAREMAAEILRRDLKIIDEDWVKQPLQLVLARLQAGIAEATGEGVRKRLQDGVDHALTQIGLNHELREVEAAE